MASVPCFRERDGFELQGSGSLDGDYPRLTDSHHYHRHPLLVTECAAPVFPVSDDDGGDVSTNGVCSTQVSDRLVFLCFKEPRFWPSVVDAAESDRLPRLLSTTIASREREMERKTRLIICEGRDGTESSNGDVMIFPDMIRYRGLTHFDVDVFVEEVLVSGKNWLPGKPERLSGTYIFVCAHGGREVQFGILGPLIIKKLKDEVALQGLGAVNVKPCSHIDDFKRAGNLIVYSSNTVGEAFGHCYGYVTPDNVHYVINDLITKGYLKVVSNGSLLLESDAKVGTTVSQRYSSIGNNLSSHEVSARINTNTRSNFASPKEQKHKTLSRKKDDLERRKHHSSRSNWRQASGWFDYWEKEDTLAALMVMGAAASVILAYHLYKLQ